MTTKELELWKGEFGDQYTERNLFGDKELSQRVVLWQNIGLSIGVPPKNILEVGAGSGVNLAAINFLCKSTNTNMDLYAIEPNEKAAKILREQGIPNLKIIGKDAFNIEAEDASIDLVFTSGVLIHINPDDLLKAMKEIYRVSKRTIICIEYFSPELREIKYRDRDKALWVQDYGNLWLNNFKLTCTGNGFWWKRISGLDNLTHWAFEKVN